MIGALLARREARKAFAALTQQDLDAFLSAYADDATYEYPTNTVLGGVFEGKDAIRQWWVRLFARMPETTFTIRHLSVERPATFGRSNYLHIQWEVDETDVDGNSYHLAGVTALEVEGGKATHVKCFVFDQDVLAEIWPQREPANAT